MAGTNELYSKILLRNDTASNWSSSTLGLEQGELAVEFVTEGTGAGAKTVPKLKVGLDGSKTFAQLEYVTMTPGEIQAAIDEAVGEDSVNSVSLASGTNNGTLKLEDYQLDQWRLMHVGAQPVPPSLIRHWLEYFPHHDYDTNYGLSESTGPGCVHLGLGNVHKVGAIGVPGYNWKAKIVDEDGELVAQGEVGELCVKGPGVMVEYYHDPEATAEVLKDGWLHTGDMARKDEDGFIFLVDRKKDVIISGGENLYPVQIEAFLAAHPKIHDVAVIGLPDKRLGEIAAAIIQVKEGMEMTEDEVGQFCVDLPRYKRPRKIIFADVIRNATGKIDKPRLRERYQAVRIVEEQNKA